MEKIITILFIVSGWGLLLSFIWFLNGISGNIEIDLNNKKWCKEIKEKHWKYNLIATIIIILLCTIQTLDYLNIIN